MGSKKKASTVVESIPEPRLDTSFRRTQWFETAKTVIQIFLMAVGAIALFIFIILIMLAGVTNYLPITPGVQALSDLFSEIAQNAKEIGLFALGFFFREYLLGKKQGDK